jgi:hypothetical protein
MSSLEGVGIGITQQQGLADLKKGQPLTVVSHEDPQALSFEDRTGIAFQQVPRPRVSTPPAPVITVEVTSDTQDQGVHIGVCNSAPVNMRVNGKGEAEYNCGNAGWSKSPPLSLSKSRIRMALDTLKTMGIDVKGYEKSLGAFDNSHAPVSLLAEDDIHHSVSVLQSLHLEKAQMNQPKKGRLPQINNPLVLTNPDYETQSFNISPSRF